MTLVYNGTFEGFLSLVYEVYYKKFQVEKILKEFPNTLILDDIFTIEYDEKKSIKVLDSLKSKFTQKNFSTILNTFMCDSKEFELDLLHFIMVGFKNQKQLENINLSFVQNIQNLQKELFRHNHKMTGFTRFAELEDGLLYAKIDSKFNVVYFLGQHFLKRFNNQRYIIHDIKRQVAFIKENSFVGVQNIAEFEIPKVSVNEEKFSKLWQTFFTSVSIESRKNKKLQRQMIPLLYRTYMNEFHD